MEHEVTRATDSAVAKARREGMCMSSPTIVNTTDKTPTEQ